MTQHEGNFLCGCPTSNFHGCSAQQGRHPSQLDCKNGYQIKMAGGPVTSTVEANHARRTGTQRSKMWAEGRLWHLLQVYL